MRKDERRCGNPATAVARGYPRGAQATRRARADDPGIRHGYAQEARVSLKMLKQGVRLSIRDNGRGFNQNVAKRAGHGLANMAARAQKIGGRFTILSKVNEGTRVVLDLPSEAADVHR